MYNVKPLLFQTNNNDYFYDDSTGIVLRINQEEKEFLEKLNAEASLEDLAENEQLTGLLSNIKKYRLFSYDSTDTISKYDEEYIKSILDNLGVSHLCIIMTDECNLRCKYCIYSDHYSLSKSYRNKHISFEIAKKAIDYQYEINQRSVQHNPNLKPSIGFYGGEPLIVWNTMVQIVEYVVQLYKEHYVFNITTNGLLLNREKIQYMLDNNFSICVSLDGAKEDHDRNRVDLNSKGTFDRIFDNLKTLHEEVKKRKERGQSVIDYSILVTEDNLSNLSRINEFFKDNPWLNEHVLNVNKVNNSNTDYYDDQSSEFVLETRREQLNTLLEEYKTSNIFQESNKFLEKLFYGLTARCANIDCYKKNVLRGFCIPGSHKLTVDVDGVYHICEKINPNYKIGSVDSGLDYSKIAYYLNSALGILNEKCKQCNLKNICSICFVQMESDQEFVFNDDYCKEFKDSVSSAFGLYYSIEEEKLENKSKLRKEVEKCILY